MRLPEKPASVSFGKTCAKIRMYFSDYKCIRVKSERNGGEKVKIKAVSFSLLALLMVFAFGGMVSLAEADKTDGQWVIASQHTTGTGPVIPGEVMTTDSGVIQYRGFSQVHYGVLTIGSTSYPIYSIGVWDAAFNPITGVLVRHDDVVWYISSNGSPDGFVGNIEAKAIDFNPVTRRYSTVDEHCLLQGFGSFAGQTLMLSYNGPPPGPSNSWTGFDLMR